MRISPAGWCPPSLRRMSLSWTPAGGSQMTLVTQEVPTAAVAHQGPANPRTKP